MDLEAALKRIKELEDKTADLEEKLYKANAFINELLLKLQNQKEKTNIAIIKQFESKTEKIDKIVIDEIEENIKEKKSKKGETHSKKFEGFDFESLVSETRVIEPDELICPKCGEKLIKVTEDISYLIESIPGSLKVIKVITNGYKCPNCNKEDNKLYYKVKDDIFPHSILTPSFASYIAYHKYELGIPFHHLSKHISNTLKIDVSKQDLANYMMRSAEALEPVFERMKLECRIITCATNDRMNYQAGAFICFTDCVVFNGRIYYEFNDKLRINKIRIKHALKHQYCLIIINKIEKRTQNT